LPHPVGPTINNKEVLGNAANDRTSVTAFELPKKLARVIFGATNVTGAAMTDVVTPGVGDFVGARGLRIGTGRGGCSAGD
jgi:hypothetical protein